MSAINDGWRSGGLLIHPTSLDSPYGVGDLGPSAHNMIKFLKRAGFHFWQTLPLTPTSAALGNSPYSSFSAFAGNPVMISPDLMVRDGWLKAEEACQARLPGSNKVDFEKTVSNKQALIDVAFERAEFRLGEHGDFQKFLYQQGSWLNDYAFFMAAKDFFCGRPWTEWPDALKNREEGALRDYGLRWAQPILKTKFAQFLFFTQLEELKNRLNQEGLGLIGDAAIYLNHDSCDVWTQRHLFQLDEQGQPTAVAGVPPDYFAKNGQLWGNPLFNWPVHAQSGFDWWKHRLRHNLSLCDFLRLDHFRAFAAYWSVSAEAATAVAGRWCPGPGADLFAASSEGGQLNIIAEDLGFITPDVTELRRRFQYPGMRILQFAFGTDMGQNSHVPYRIAADNVVYPGTHDNNTTRGWFKWETDTQQRRQLAELAGAPVTEKNAAAALIRLAWLSPGTLAVATIQDILNLDETARLNVPGTAQGNWNWKLKNQTGLSEVLANQLADLSALAGRDNKIHPNLLKYEGDQ